MSVFGLHRDAARRAGEADRFLHSTVSIQGWTLDLMSIVAQELRKARETQKLTLSQAAEITKIRSDHLEALEESRFEVFPAAVYVRGSVRTYATLLKLDVPAIMASLDTELSQKKGFSQAIPAPGSRGILDFIMLQLSKLNWKTSLVIVGAGLAVLVLTCSYFFWR